MPDAEWILLYLLLGAVVGFVAGLLGVGGGGIMVPLLTLMFTAQGFANEITLHLALGTSMAAIVLTALASLRAHQRHGGVLWPVVWQLTPGVVIGTMAGSQLAALLPREALAIFFSLFMLTVALQMAFALRPAASRELPGKIVTGFIGGAIGAVSALVAIGGGTLTVPFLYYCNITMRQAVGTAAAVGLPIAIAGTLGYAYAGLAVAARPEGAFGYLYLPAVLLISSTSMLTAPLGARLAHSVPQILLKRLFSLLLLALSLSLLISTMR
ncbi:MAG: sulfite exporter TauE/SafE family protein [Gammaproteobacteria bacterium]|nr:sulfite exporter TauE/SafE family protein [Gammaproteobacteria bacterium]